MTRIDVRLTGPECDGPFCTDYAHEEGCSLFRPYSHEFANGTRCYNENPVLFITHDDCGHADPDDGPEYEEDR